jgi:DNA-binding NtrC family response regulator
VSRECILLVEDNDDLREILSEQLLGADFDVRQAKDTETALRLFEYDRNIQLLLTDFRLDEKKNGVELALDLRLKLPDLPIIIISGYTDEARRAANGRFSVIPKPIQKSDLITAVKLSIAKDVA